MAEPTPFHILTLYLLRNSILDYTKKVIFKSEKGILAVVIFFDSFFHSQKKKKKTKNVLSKVFRRPESFGFTQERDQSDTNNAWET